MISLRGSLPCDHRVWGTGSGRPWSVSALVPRLRSAARKHRDFGDETL